MEKSQNFLTIKAFAEAAGRSQQTIYKQIGTRLASYVHEIEGQKYIEHRALKEVFGIDIEQPVQPKDDNSFNRDEASEHPLYAILKAELEAKNGLIEQLQAELAEERKHSREQAKELIRLAEQAQALHAGTLKELLPEASSAEVPEVIEMVQEDTAASVPDEKEILQGFLQDAKKEIDALNAEKVQTQEAVIQGLSWREIFRLKFRKKE